MVGVRVKARLPERCSSSGRCQRAKCDWCHLCVCVRVCGVRVRVRVRVRAKCDWCHLRVCVSVEVFGLGVGFEFGF